MKVGEISIGHKEKLPDCHNKKYWNGLLRESTWSFVRHTIKKN